MHDFTPVPAFIGGALIGLSASLFLLGHGRVAGISGLYATILRRGTEHRFTAVWFIAGLLLAGLAVRLVHPASFATPWSASLPVALVAGLIVGVGTQLGNGCTSGHGVCGVSRLSVRSILATVTFIGTGAVTVFVTRHLVGGG